MKFNDINLNEKIIEVIHEQGFDELTTIQEKCIPEILNGYNVVGQAETGSGKTLAFCLPILDKIIPGNGVQAVVVTPTRELCVQVKDEFSTFGKKRKIEAMSVYGGVKIDQQIKNLRTADVVVATPGRMLDHIRRRTIDFRNVVFLVLDELDKMFEMGFVDDVEDIIYEIPRERQILMFSATITNDVNGLINKHAKNPLIIRTKSFVDPGKLKQVFYDIHERNDKFSILLHLLKANREGLSIIFCATRAEADVLEKNLRQQNVKVSAIHGGMKQNRRMRSLTALKEQKTEVLVATDVAARGLDIKNVNAIYNYDVPQTSKDYTHRIGRTARAGEEGIAITLLTKRDHDNFRRVQGADEHEIEEKEIPDFRRVPFKRGFEKKNNWKKPNKYRRKKPLNDRGPGQKDDRKKKYYHQKRPYNKGRKKPVQR